MRAAVVEQLTGPDAVQIREFPEPAGAHALAGGQRVLVEVHAASVSFPDLLQSRGAYQLSTDPPFVTGGEFAGIVLEADPESGFAPGDRVAGLSMWGAVAEYALALPLYTVKLPDSVDFATGSALVLNGATAVFAVQRGGVQAGETALVHGAAGGVGTALIEVLKHLGARCIAVVSTDEKERVARELGADEVVRSTGPWLEEVRALTDGYGVEVVLDPVGGDRFTDSLRALDVCGRLVVIGFAGGEIPTVKVNRLLLRDLTVTGVGLDPMERRFPGTTRRVTSQVVELAAQGALTPRIGARLALEDAAEALRLLDRRQVSGNIVVDVRPGS
jgi:NADPH2:quinone reductase